MKYVLILILSFITYVSACNCTQKLENGKVAYECNNVIITYLEVNKTPNSTQGNFSIKLSSDSWGDNHYIKEEVVGSVKYDQLFTMFMMAISEGKSIWIKHDANKNIIAGSVYP